MYSADQKGLLRKKQKIDEMLKTAFELSDEERILFRDGTFRDINLTKEKR